MGEGLWVGCGTQALLADDGLAQHRNCVAWDRPQPGNSWVYGPLPDRIAPSCGKLYVSDRLQLQLP